jgi:hypothetical protein
MDGKDGIPGLVGRVKRNYFLFWLQVVVFMCGGFLMISLRPYGTEGLCSTQTQGSASLHPGLFSYSPYREKGTGFIPRGSAKPVDD